MTDKIHTAMKQAVEDGFFPSAELLVSRQNEILLHHHYGKCREGTCFDIASLTKPVCTATLTMQLVAEELFSLSDKISQWFPAILPDYQKISVEHLLAHTSGLPAWCPYFRELPLDLVGTEQGKQFILDNCLNEETICQPGIQTLYSDIGYILLGAILEKVGLHTLEGLFQHRIATPLKLKNTFFVRNIGMPISSTSKRGYGKASQHVPTGEYKTEASPHLHKRFAPTEDCPWRGRVVHGEVHDPNAYAMGGVAGHAGLFSTATDLHQFVSALIACYKGESDWIPQTTVKQFLDFNTSTLRPSNTFVLGWDRPAPKNSAAGNYFSPNSIGHLGFTGCSLWIDLEKEIWIILLANRIHPDATNEKIKTFRPMIHNLIWKELLSPK